MWPVVVVMVTCVLHCVVEDDKPKKYDRSFLLSFAENKACQEPPAGLVKNLDVFLKDGGQILIKLVP